MLYRRERGVIEYQAGGGECRMRLPAWSRRHPDQAIISPRAVRPPGMDGWVLISWSVVSPGGEQRDFVDKVEEYLRVGPRVLDPRLENP